MRYQIRPIGVIGFSQFELSLIVETRQEYVFLHDNVITQFAQPSDFIGDFFNAGHGDIEFKQGVVPLKLKQTVEVEFVSDLNGGHLIFNGEKFSKQPTA